MAETGSDKRVNYSGFIIGAILSPVLLLFIYFGKGEMGRAACIGLAGILLAIKIRWDLRNRFWFWGIIAVLLALHIPLLLLIRWPSGWVPAIAALPFALADFLIVLGAVRFVEKFILKTVPPDGEA